MDTLLGTFNEHPVIGCAAAGLAVFLYVAALANEKMWYQFEALLGVSCLFGLPFSGFLLRTWLDGKDGDATAKGLFGLILLGMISLAYQVQSTKRARDAVVTASLHLTCILSRAGLLFAAISAIYFSSGFSTEALMADCIFLSLLILGNLIHLKKVSRKDGKLRTDGNIRQCVLLEAIVSFVLALAIIGFSDAVADLFGEKQQNPVHAMLIKSFGFQAIAFSIQSFSSLSFKRDSDIIKLYLPKLWILLPIMAWIMWNIRINTITPYGFCCVGSLFILAATNLWICSHGGSSGKRD